MTYDPKDSRGLIDVPGIGNLNRAGARRGLEPLSGYNRPLDVIYRPTWGISDEGSGKGFSEHVVDQPIRYGGIQIGPESEVGIVRVWPGAPIIQPATILDPSRSFLVSARRPFIGTIQGPLIIHPEPLMVGVGGNPENYDGILQLLLLDAIPEMLGNTNRTDARYADILAIGNAGGAVAETTALRKIATARSSGKLLITPNGLAGGESMRVRLYGVTMSRRTPTFAGALYETTAIFDQTYVAADTGIERAYHFEARFDGYRLTWATGAAGVSQLNYDLLLRDEMF